jgi:hypothetical protein
MVAGLAFTATHRHGQEERRGNYKNWEGKPAPTLLTWWPKIALGSYTGQYQGAWHVTGTSDYIVLGGEFPKVNGKAQQGLVRSPSRASPRTRSAPA